jgi:hypothetical protein
MSTTPIGISYGYRGPNLVRNFAVGDCSRVFGVADLNAANLAKCRRLCPDVVTTYDVRYLLRDPPHRQAAGLQRRQRPVRGQDPRSHLPLDRRLVQASSPEAGPPVSGDRVMNVDLDDGGIARARAHPRREGGPWIVKDHAGLAIQAGHEPPCDRRRYGKPGCSQLHQGRRRAGAHQCLLQGRLARASLR